MMSLSFSLGKIEKLVEKGVLSPEKEYLERAPVVIVRILSKVISAQNNNGSWGPRHSVELTAYAIIAIISVAAFPYMHVLEIEIQHSLAKAGAAMSMLNHQWLNTALNSGQQESHEAFYATQAYALTAMRMLLTNRLEYSTKGIYAALKEKVLQFSQWFSSTDYLKDQPFFVIKAAILEASFYKLRLQVARGTIFPLTKSKEADKYMEYIPIMWTIPSTSSKESLSPEYIVDMSVLSMWIFLVDEYMESNVINFSDAQFAQFRAAIESDNFGNGQPNEEMSENGQNPVSKIDGSQSMEKLNSAILLFDHFAESVLRYSHVKNASLSDRLELKYETVNYLLFHLTQLEDNIRFGNQTHREGENTKFLSPKMPWHTWVHTIGAGHVSGPFSFAFLKCLLGGLLRDGDNCFSSATQNLMAFKMNSHIGSFCRIYNDYGSVKRDREERNINSINFPEFFLGVASGPHQVKVTHEETHAKRILLESGIFERQCALETADKLYKSLETEGETGTKITDALKVYMGGCEQFSDMYLTKDVTNSVN
jgi:hypothetical protein